MIKRCGLLVIGMMAVSTLFAQTSKELRPLNEFSFNLYDELKKENQNVFFSPLSTYVSLGILSDGAAGSNKAQIDSVLGLGKKVTLDQVRNRIDQMLSRQLDDGVIRMANGCWIDRSISLKKDFYKSFQSQSNSHVAEANMKDPASVVESVNAWADEATEGTIPELLSVSSISPATKMLLCNSLYLNLPWELEFKPRSTRVQTFTDANAVENDLKFMRKMEYMEYAYDKKFHIVIRNLDEGDQAVCIVVPKEGYSLEEVEEDLTSKKLSKIMNRTYDQRVILSLPKFTMDGEFSFKQPLINMGLEEAFSNAPDFSAMSNDNLKVDEISQKVKIDVNEKRIVAAAVTIVRMGLGSAAGMPNPDEPIDVAADHPFLFFVIDKPTNGIFFMGRYAIPSQQDIVESEE